MRLYVVVASVNELHNIAAFKAQLVDSGLETKIVIVDEGVEESRKINASMLDGLDVEFYGPKERAEWFVGHFGRRAELLGSVIPERCHAETSFGFLVTWLEQADVIIEVDDDVFPVVGYNLPNDHVENLFDGGGTRVESAGRWYNTMENLEINVGEVVFARGHPYSSLARMQNYSWSDVGSQAVLNMGQWVNHPDLDALTIFCRGGMEGICDIRSNKLRRRKLVIGKGTYIPISSMNTSFRREIVPAFYQLYMRYMGIDRFDDIWSGVFLKRIVDHLGHYISIGAPVVAHNRTPRSTARDLSWEIRGLGVNEVLWRIIDEAEISGHDYLTCYMSLVDELEARLDYFRDKNDRDFMTFVLGKMRLWTEVIDLLD